MNHQLDNKGKIRRATLLFYLSSLGGYILVISIVTVEAGRDGWIAVIPAWLLAVIIGLTVFILANRYPGQTPIDYLPKIIGKIPGRLLGLILILALLVFPILVMKYYIEMMALFIPETPAWALLIIGGIVIAYTLYKGFETYVRAIAIIFPLSLFLIVISLIFILPELEWNKLAPILEDGIQPLSKVFPHLAGYSISGILLISMFLPAVMPTKKLNGKNSLKKWFVIAFMSSGVFLAFNAALQIAFCDEKLTSELTFPIMYLSRYIQIGEFITGFEAMLIFFWISIVFYHSLMFFMYGVGGLSSLLKRDVRIFSIIVVIVICGLSLLIPDYSSLLEIDKQLVPPIYISIGMLFPIILLIDTIKKKIKSNHL